MTPGRLLALSLALIVLPGLGQAQEADPTSAPPAGPDSLPRFEAAPISIEVPRPSLTAGGASVVLVGLDSLPLPPASLLEEGLRELPLVQIRTNSRGEAHLALRGARSRQVAVLLDGVPLTIGWDHRTDLSVIPLQAVRELRLVRGPSSLLHGPNVLGGVVELGVQKAPDAGLPPLQAAFGTDRTGARSAAVQASGRPAVGPGTFVLRAGAGVRTRDGAVLPAGVRQPGGQLGRRLNSDLRHGAGFLAVRYVLPGGAWTSASAFGYAAEKGVPPELHVEEPRLWRIPDAHRLFATLAAGTGWRGTGRGRGTLQAALGVDQGGTTILSYADPGYDEVSGREVAEDLTLSARVTGEHSLGRGSVRSAVTYARTAHDERIDDDPGTRFVQRLWSLGAEVEQPLGGSAALSAGAVLDGADTPETGGREPLGRLWAWGARTGGTVAFGQSVTLHGGASRRVRFPSLRELYSAALGTFAPNPNLRPETLTVGEAGVTASGAVGEVQAVAFHQRLEGAISRTVTFDGRLMRVNGGEIRSTGMEVLGQVRMGPATGDGSLTLQRVRQRVPGGEAPAEYEPAVAGHARVGVPLPFELRGETAVELVGRQFCVHPDRESLVALAPSAQVDLALERAWTLPGPASASRLLARVAVANAADAAVYDQCGLPRSGRTLRLELRFR